MKIKCLLLLISFQIYYGLKAQNNQPIELTEVEYHEISKIAPYIEHAVVVGMGESTHGTHEFFKSRIRIFQYLVEFSGFNTFFLEADFANCLEINDYIHGKDGIPELLIKGIGIWPWETKEMIELVEWMRAYQQKKPERKLSFIGVDIQKMHETTTKMIELLDQKTPTTLLEINKISSNEFLLLNKSDVKKKYLPALEDLKQVDVSNLDENDTELFKILSLHIDQIINSRLSKSNVFRDIKMAENILFHLERDKNIKGFFWAHNLHVGNYYNEKKKSGIAGGMLKQTLKENYFSIGQEFYEGTFNVYYTTTQNKSSMNVNDYILGPVTVGPAAEGSIANTYRNKYKLPVFIPFKGLPESEEVYMTNIGNRFVINDNPKSIWRYNHHGKSVFDALLLIDISTPTMLVK